MLSEIIQLSFDKIMQTRSYTVVVLGTKEKKFAIYADASVGRILQMYLTDTPKQRPLTHDLISTIFSGYDMKVMQVVINDMQDTIYFSRLFLESQENELRHILEIDCRPSDSLILALIHNAPVYCTREVLERTIAIEE